MNSNQLKFIQGRDVFLRPLIEEDYNERYLSWLNDPEVNRYSQRRFRPTPQDMLRALESSKDRLHLAICLNSDNQHVGNINLGPINWLHRFAEISILVGDKEVWGRGIGSQAIYLLSRHALITMGLNRVEAGSANPGFNKAVIEKLGWIEEGCRRQRFFLDGEFLDVVLTALLRKDFQVIPEYEA